MPLPAHHSQVVRSAQLSQLSIAALGLCAKLGLCAYWLSSDRWPDRVDEPTSHHDFKAEARRLVRT